MKETIDAKLTPIVTELLSDGITLVQAVDAFEQKYMTTALQKCGGNVTQTSKLLGVHRNTFMNKRAVTAELLKVRARRRALAMRGFAGRKIER